MSSRAKSCSSGTTGAANLFSRDQRGNISNGKSEYSFSFAVFWLLIRRTCLNNSRYVNSLSLSFHWSLYMFGLLHSSTNRTKIFLSSSYRDLSVRNESHENMTSPTPDMQFVGHSSSSQTSRIRCRMINHRVELCTADVYDRLQLKYIMEVYTYLRWGGSPLRSCLSAQ